MSEPEEIAEPTEDGRSEKAVETVEAADSTEIPHLLGETAPVLDCCYCGEPMEMLFPELAGGLLGCDCCKLLWFRHGQMERVDLMDDRLEDFAHSSSGVELKSGIQEQLMTDKGKGRDSKPVSKTGKLECSSCDIPMHFHKYFSAPQVFHPECYSCGAICLSAAMLKEIRENSMNAAQLEAYRNQLAHSIVGYTQAEEATVARKNTKNFAKMWQKWRYGAREKADD